VPDESTTTTAAEVLPIEVTTSVPEATTSSAAASDTEVTTTSIEDEVKGTEVLPFTGVEHTDFGLLGLAMLAAGALLVVGTRSSDD